MDEKRYSPGTSPVNSVESVLSIFISWIGIYPVDIALSILWMSTTIPLTKCPYFSVLPTDQSYLNVVSTPLQLHHATLPCYFADFGRYLPWKIGNVALDYFSYLFS